jgi:anti-anti-sigma factor
VLYSIFPFLQWFKGYDKGALRADVVSGLTVALVLIPQSMAYAQLAGMPAYYGLYASLLPPLIAAMFGSSRQLATGPVAVVSLMTAASLEPLATAGSEGYIAYAILLAFMVGVFQFLLGVLRLGLVVNFLSHPVVNGFTNAAAIIIASSQLAKIFGVSVDKAEHHYETILRVLDSAWQYTHWPTLGMGLLAFAIMVGAKRINPKIPNVLVAVVVTTALSWATGFHHDAKVSLSAIQAHEVKTAVAQYNTILSHADELIAQRTALTAQLDEAKDRQDKEGVLDAEHDLGILAVHLGKLTEEAHGVRSFLRVQLLEGVEESEGHMAFYAQGSVPSGMHADGRMWRLKVGNSAIDAAKITMMGGGAVVGTIPSGMPSLVVPTMDSKIILHLMPFAVVISLLGFMEAISIAKAMAAKTGQRLDPNQELIGQGLANMLGAFGKSYPASGSFSRSAVNLQAGAVTGMSSVFTSVMVAVVLMFFTPLLYHLPQAVLAAVIMMAVIGLINSSGFIHAWKAQWYDGAISILSFVCTLVFAPHLDKGIVFGVALSLFVFLFKSMRPNVEFVSVPEKLALPDSVSLRLDQREHCALVRFEGPLFFANASYLEDQVAENVMNNADLEHIIVDAQAINEMDSSGEEALAILVNRMRSEGRDIWLCGVNDSVMAVLRRTNLLGTIGMDHIYPSVEGALQTIRGNIHLDSPAKATGSAA